MAVPTPTLVTPDHGPDLGGTMVIITGSGFTGTTNVDFDPIPAASFNVDSDSQITAVSPPHVDGASPIQLIITNPDGQGAIGFTFTFTDTPPAGEPPGMDCPTVIVGGFLADGGTPDGDGIVYTVQSLTGWWDTPPVRSETMEAQPTGEYPTVYRENARRPVLVIVAHAPTSVALGGLLCWTAIAAVKAAFDALYVPVLMEVTDPVNDRSALVRLAAPIRTKILGATVAARIEISLLAPNPTLT